MVGQSRYLEPELQRVVKSGTMGPIGYWLVAELFARGNAKKLPAVFAQHGLEILDGKAFRADCEQLFGNAWPYVVRIARALGKLNDADLDEVAKLTSVSRQSVHDICSAMDRKSDEEAFSALLDALERLWEDQWCHHVESRMREVIAAQSSATAQAPAEEQRTIGLSPFR